MGNNRIAVPFKLKYQATLTGLDLETKKAIKADNTQAKAVTIKILLLSPVI